MSSARQESPLSRIGVELSHFLLKRGQELKRKSIKTSKTVLLYVVNQIDFLRKFNYSHANIKRHFNDKAERFFGISTAEPNIQKRRTKSKKARFKLGDTEKRSLMKWGKSKFSKKNVKKKGKNIYQTEI